METINLLNEKEIPLFTLAEIGSILGVTNRESISKRISRLIKNKILKKLINGKYEYLLKKSNDLTRANFLYQPSYVSLESALSFHSIITQFPYEISSITTKKTKSFEVSGKNFSYSQILPEYFFGYKKNDNFLIAEPEKALLDYIYFAKKGLRKLDLDEMDLKRINMKTFKKWGNIMGIFYKI